MKVQNYDKYVDLSNAIRWDSKDLLAETLHSNDRLDLTYRDGALFNLAIDIGNLEIIQLLLTYFHDNQLSQYSAESLEYFTLKKKMHDILEIAVEDVELSEEMKALLSEYINFDDDKSDTLSDLAEEPNPKDFEDSSYSSDSSLPSSTEGQIHHEVFTTSSQAHSDEQGCGNVFPLGDSSVLCN